MKLVSIELSDVRRFVDPVRIDGIGAGLNVLCAPNEFGKSTLFDALQALFFQPHRSASREVKALRPHVGGSPCVTVEVDLPDGRYRLAKRWLGRAQATVHRNDTLIHQADAAEAFIAGLVQAEGDGGPAGLLWVRQGLTRLEGDGDTAKDREAAKSARRNLMTSVTGEVEALTGGRRMDRALARTREELARYISLATEKAIKNGPLADAQGLVATLTDEKARLAATARELEAALVRRRQVKKDLATLTDPEASAERQTRLEDATRRFDEAKRHAEALASSAITLRSAELTQATLTERLANLHRSTAAAAKAATDLAAGETAARSAKEALATAEAAIAPLAASLAAARNTKAHADAQLAKANRALAAAASAARRKDLADRIAKATKLTGSRAPLALAAAKGPDSKALGDLQTLAQAVAIERALRDRSAPKIAFRHVGTARVTTRGKPVPETEFPVIDEADFDMPGLGSFTIRPAGGQDTTGLERAEAALTAALERLGVADLKQAEAEAAARAEATSALRDIDAALSSLAPQGLAALESELAALPEPDEDDPDLPDVAEAQARADEAARNLVQAEAAHDSARTEVEHLRGQEVRASVKAASLADEAARIAVVLAAFGPDPEATLLPELANAATKLQAARDGHAKLEAAAPDFATAEAALTRARSVLDAAQAEIQRLQTERADLDATIRIRSGAGVMEELADTEARLAAANEDLAVVNFEVAVLKELAAALESARNEARERYFEPVLAELRPLLRILWPDAELRFDGESLLPSALVRDGREEPLSILSGGTQEQIALLVRLAFARLLAVRGHHAPVIFDDALVYTDDDRVEKMFDALHTQASGQQIIVFSCRQRAFRDLGGTRLAMRQS